MRYLICFIFALGCQNAPTVQPQAMDSAVMGQENPSGTAAKAPYSLETPDKVYTMPSKLSEISGISAFRDNELVCVEDEHGKVYVYNTAKEEVTETIHFEKKGDFEDITVYNNSIYVLRSDGIIFRINGEEVEEIDPGLKKKDNCEGLFADKQNHRLLIASKEKSTLYALDLRTNETKTLWTLQEKDFAPSALAIHPVTQDIYMISTVSRAMLVLSEDGNIIERHPLPRKVFEQPEGISFAANGDLYISNEGRDGKGNILFFRYQKQ
jgi:uncharacterized protein YjiK